ncbi:unnamed protein product, partial [Polarella glacialis]
PESGIEFRRFLSEIALGSVRSVSLPVVATLQLLAEQSRGLLSGGDLGGLEVLELPEGCGASLDSVPVPRLPSLQRLLVHAGPCGSCDALGVAGAAWLEALLESLTRPLGTLQLEELDPALASPILEAALPLPPAASACRVRRLVFRRC